MRRINARAVWLVASALTAGQPLAFRERQIASDLSRDGRRDVACIGSATANLKWYENVGTRRK